MSAAPLGDGLPERRRDLERAEKAFGAGAAETIDPALRLADTYASQASYGEAESLYARVLAVQKNVLGPNHKDVAVTRDRLAGAKRAQGSIVKPLQLVRKRIHLITVPQRDDTEYDITIVGQNEGLWKLRKAVDTLYEQSASSAKALDTLKDAGEAS